MTPQDARTEVAFGLGSNLGDKRLNLDRALAAMTAAGIVDGLRRSALFRTEPWGPVVQDWYVNACAVGTTDLSPAELLVRVKALETALGRVETVRWGPRVIDIDILYYGDVTLKQPSLTLPHPGMLARPFVIIPLAQLRPDLRFDDRSLADLAASVDATGIEPLNE